MRFGPRSRHKGLQPHFTFPVGNSKREFVRSKFPLSSRRERNELFLYAV